MKIAVWVVLAVGACALAALLVVVSLPSHQPPVLPQRPKEPGRTAQYHSAEQMILDAVTRTKATGIWTGDVRLDWRLTPEGSGEVSFTPDPEIPDAKPARYWVRYKAVGTSGREVVAEVTKHLPYALYYTGVGRWRIAVAAQRAMADDRHLDRARAHEGLPPLPIRSYAGHGTRMVTIRPDGPEYRVEMEEEPGQTSGPPTVMVSSDGTEAWLIPGM